MKKYSLSRLARSFLLLTPNHLSSAGSSSSLRSRSWYHPRLFSRPLSSAFHSAPSPLVRWGGISTSSISRPLLFVRRDTELASGLHVTSNANDEPRTGWLHNTEAPKSYTVPTNNESISSARRMLIAEMMKSYRNHRIIHPPAFHPCGENQRMVVTEHKVAVPVTYPDMESARASFDAGSKNHRINTVDRIDIGFDNKDSFDRPKLDMYFSVIELVSSSEEEEFFRSLVTLSPQQRAERYLRRTAAVLSDKIDGSRSSSCIDPSRMLLYLQGGPGFGCASPVSGISLASSKSSWAAQVLLGGLTNTDGKSFQRVILMDQRGTGRSSPITKQRLQKMFPDLFSLDNMSGDDGSSPAMQMVQAKFSKALADATEYLTKFRADSIVRDAEWIKDTLIKRDSAIEEDTFGDNVPRPWGAALGQSFGGFCIMTYLSSITHPPKLCLLTGGIAPMNTPVREVYDRLWLKVRERNWRYYEQYPGDVAAVKRIVLKLMTDVVKLPSGGILTARRFLQLGLGLGGTPGANFAALHSLINSAFVDDASDELCRSFLKQVDNQQSFDDAPLYFLLHESIYADGPGATEWAAHASYESMTKSPNQDFDYKHSVNNTDEPTLFFGEMVFPWMGHGDYPEVSGHGMRMLSEALATKSDWLPLFDSASMRLALVGNEEFPPKTKAAAAVYYDDMYVDFDCSVKLVRRGNPLEGVKVWITNEYQHSGLRDDGANIVEKLVGIAKGSINVPS
eukprot:CCRYP_018690-RA/>CCRYP_018690-RA protein AED:0.24 eAED:0.31 QI:0/0/0/1/1/1/2/0/734